MVFIVSMWLLLSINIVCSIRSNSMFTFYFLVSSLCGTLNRQLKQHSRTALHLIAFQHMPLAYDTKPVCLQREVLRMNALHDESRMEINEHESPKKSAYAGKYSMFWQLVWCKICRKTQPTLASHKQAQAHKHSVHLHVRLRTKKHCPMLHHKAGLRQRKRSLRNNVKWSPETLFSFESKNNWNRCSVIVHVWRSPLVCIAVNRAHVPRWLTSTWQSRPCFRSSS